MRTKAWIFCVAMVAVGVVCIAATKQEFHGEFGPMQMEALTRLVQIRDAQMLQAITDLDTATGAGINLPATMSKRQVVDWIVDNVDRKRTRKWETK